ncbi:MAG: hypothetical protein OEU92_12800 [Alphaproteobacteria bacterium]|nr:hypothetical protein [Alphaproteobacteria bacterium]
MPVSLRLTLNSMALAAGIGLLSCVLPSNGAADGYDLLTAEEYAERVARPLTRTMTPIAEEGPEIIVHTPQGSEGLRSPLDFDVEFRPRRAAPDMRTLKLEYDLGLFWKDVTRRMADHAEITDNRIVSRGAELPAGEHRLRMSISDQVGKTTSTEIAFTIAED